LKNVSATWFAIGLGSPHGDDRVGWEVVDRLSAQSSWAVARAREGVDLLQEDLLQELMRHEQVLIIDAASPARHPGRLNRFEWPKDDIRNANIVSTHGLGLAEALQMAESLGCTPRRVVIVTIEAKEIGPCDELSDEVDRCADRLVGLLLDGGFAERLAELPLK
jgi:hydrogenase maturation protease